MNLQCKLNTLFWCIARIILCANLVNNLFCDDWNLRFCALTSVGALFVLKGGEEMFDNIGFKIQMLAFVSTIIGVVFSIIAGIICMSTSILYGIIVAVVGSFVSWIGSFAFFGLGQLIENTDRLVVLMEKTTGEKTNEKSENSTTYPKITVDPYHVNNNDGYQAYRCAQCNELIRNRKCEYCGFENDVTAVHQKKYNGHQGRRCAQCNELIKDKQCEYCGFENNV